MTKAHAPKSLKVAAVVVLTFAAPATLIEIASARIHAITATADPSSHLSGGVR